jgi:hypothetical protein
MPFVSSYYRRAAGAGSPDANSPARKLDVAVYDAGGINLLRDRYGVRYALRDLSFSSALPGGYAACSFTIERPAARRWSGRANLRVEVRAGSRVLWWGWIEDFSRPVRGSTERLQVSALGPWQIAQQRLISVSYAGTVYSEAAVGDCLRMYCPEISTDFSRLTSTGKNLAPLTYTRQQVAKLIKLACDMGDSAGRPLLFALWAPTYRALNGYPASMTLNPQMEYGSGSLPDNWAFEVSSGNPLAQWVTDRYQSPTRGVKIYRGSGTGTQVGWIKQNFLGITPGVNYAFDYKVYAGSVNSLNTQVNVTWLTAADGYISTASTTHTSTGTAGWTRYVDNFVAPANAGKVILKCWTALPDSGAQSFAVWDDVYVYPAGSEPLIDTKPRAHLWPKDLSGFDYRLYTRQIDDGLVLTETTRDLANKVIVTYGDTGVTTGTDAASQARYRQRDIEIAAGSVSQSVAESIRDVTLAERKNPKSEPGDFKLQGRGALRTGHGLAVDPLVLRAGDRVQVADGPRAGLVLLLTQVSYANGVVSATPDREVDTAMLR